MPEEALAEVNRRLTEKQAKQTSDITEDVVYKTATEAWGKPINSEGRPIIERRIEDLSLRAHALLTQAWLEAICFKRGDKAALSPTAADIAIRQQIEYLLSNLV